jgi:hypothetical protein
MILGRDRDAERLSHAIADDLFCAAVEPADPAVPPDHCGRHGDRFERGGYVDVWLVLLHGCLDLATRAIAALRPEILPAARVCRPDPFASSSCERLD